MTKYSKNTLEEILTLTNEIQQRVGRVETHIVELKQQHDNLLAACEAAKRYIDWGWGKLGTAEEIPEHPGPLLTATIAKAKGYIE